MKLYHWTKRTNMSSISQKGLITNKIGIVYLTPKPEKWKANPEEDDVCLEVETGNLKLTAFEDCSDWEVLCWGNIPLENITLCEVKQK